MKNKQDLLMMIVLYVNAFGGAFNNNIVNVALNSVMADYGISATTAQWLVSGFMIVTLIVVASMAFLYRRFPLRKLFFISQGAFIVGGLLGLFAPSFPLVLLARLIEAVGTGLAMPLMMNTVLILAKPERRGLMIGIGTTMSSLAPAFAPTVSGIFVTMFGWHTIFLVPTLLAVILLIAGFFLLRDVNDHDKCAFDPLAALILGVGLVPLAYGLTQIMANPLKAAACIAVGVVLLAIFVHRQLKADDPLINVRLMKRLAFWPSCVLILISLMTTFSVSVLIPLYLQSALGMTAMGSGLFMLPPVLCSAILGVFAGNIVDKKGPWPLLPLGFLCITLGQAFNCLLSSQCVMYLMMGSACLAYIGVGLTSSPSQTTGLTALAREETPHGTSLFGSFVQLAGCFGPTLYVGIMNSVMDGEVASGVAETTASATGISTAFAVAIAISAIGIVVAAFYARYRCKR